nr:hypothetical protein Iba_chr15fCG4910 [Ipomoea batatas]
MDQVAYMDLSVSASAQAIDCFAYLFYYGRLGSASAQLSNRKPEKYTQRATRSWLFHSLKYQLNNTLSVALFPSANQSASITVF